MSIWRNDELWLEINNQPQLATRIELWSDELLRRFPHVKVRSAPSSKAIVLIQLDSRKGFIPVREWYNNHRVQLLRMMDDLESRLTRLVPKEGKALSERLDAIDKRNSLYASLEPFMKDEFYLECLEKGYLKQRSSGKDVINNWLIEIADPEHS